MKKIVSGIGVLVFALYMMCTTAFATEGTDVTRLENLVAVSQKERGLYWPKEFEVTSASNPKTFSGKAEGSDLYLNKGVTGSTKYWISINNYRDEELKVEFRTHYSVKQTIYVPANATRSLPILNMKADEKYALKFYPKSDFDGYIYGM